MRTYYRNASYHEVDRILCSERGLKWHFTNYDERIEADTVSCNSKKEREERRREYEEYTRRVLIVCLAVLGVLLLLTGAIVGLVLAFCPCCPGLRPCVRCPC
ncbi:hypothetical protein PMAYCL1PPCAC_24682 [Pristionchus mayeri]|uniref:Uncharacterized protein n=1 Tax=Pristionchus mayeri TaxID=1317129 RepID=A0AAN5D2E9_9BILA|nr:hypothetical protein PMAYCL1PPCAC_24682 [Pristionchus mayeri]